MGLIEDIASRQERIEKKLDQLLARGPSEEPICTRREAAAIVKAGYSTVSKAENKYLLPPPIDGRSRYVRAQVKEWATLTLAERKTRYVAMVENSGPLRIAR